MLSIFNSRRVFVLIMAISFCSIAFAIFLEKKMGLEPCPLCMTQRALIFIAGTVALIAVIHNPIAWGAKIYGSVAAFIALLGIAVAARHVWLQQLPDHLVPACGPSLEYMFETLPFSETLQLVFMGD